MGKRRYVPAVGPRLKKLLFVVLGLFSLLAVNSAYMVGVSILESVTGQTYQNWFYLVMFLLHLALGALIVLPVIVFGTIHIRNAHNRPNRRAVVAGFALFGTALVLLASGIVLTRVEGFVVIRNPATRSIAYWAHVLSPLVAGWLFVLHRLAGRRIRWRVGARWAAVAAVFGGVMLVVQYQDPRSWNVTGPVSGEQYFFPSLARTATGDFIPESVLDNTEYCRECHPDVYDSWRHSVHHISSFNNPPYLFSVRETRQVAFERDGDLQASRFCAGCHDPVVFFSGRFDDPEFDDENDPTGQAGITCTACHAITNINSPRGNSDYTLDEPIHYPFAFSKDPTLAWINRQLVKAKPELHKKTFLKPLHTSAEFCGSCHKVHLPEELNKYKFLRGQNHYDSFLLSGVSGHGAQSFYYPETAQAGCNGCHMPTFESTDFGARVLDESGALKVHDHLFPSANTGLAHLKEMPPEVVERHREFSEGSVRVDLFGLRRGGEIQGELIAPLRPTVPTLEPGETYLLETVVRTLTLGHHLTQGTTDSNQLWMDVEVADDAGAVVGRSGGMDGVGRVDPWSHFVNVYMLDREGRRVDRRNAQDIFVPLYNHQIPPGAADVVHFRLEVPPDAVGTLVVRAALRYRKFDTTYLRHIYGEDTTNDLPIMTLGSDEIRFPIGRVAETTRVAASEIPEWQRWNDYGIGLLRKGGKSKGELRQAEVAFRRVEELGRADGPLNLARVYIAQGTVEDLAIGALERAASFDPPAPPWLIAWFTGIVNKQNGRLDEAIASFRSLAEGTDDEMRRRGFDFSLDYRVLNELGQTLFERAKVERGANRRAAREALLTQSRTALKRVLELDPENVAAHFNLNLVLRQLGDDELAAAHFDAYNRYRADDNAHDRAIAVARAADPAANHAAEAIVIYDLHRQGATGLAGGAPEPKDPSG
ncbi:MAG: multiheme c-type cytochrome [Acidobacteriota bacterium]|nr:multiheme c-type cytochrome [Acidobacteriota bacterium]